MSAKNNQQRGAVALTATIIVLLAMMALSAGIYFAVLQAASSIRSVEQSAQAYLAAEGGVEDMIIRLVDPAKQLPAGGSETLIINNATVTTEIAGLSGARTITANANHTDNYRIVEVVLDDNAIAANFSYAVQSGEGGVLMENNSEIIGTVYSNGPIVGNNTPSITGGDALAAQTSGIQGVNVDGDARAFTVIDGSIGGSVFANTIADNLQVGGDVRAERIEDSTIIGDAYYVTDFINSTAASLFPNTPPPDQVASASYPVTDDDLDQFQEAAVSGGVWSGTCPLTLSGSETLSVGPMVIPCDVTLQNQSRLILTGTVWIQGDFAPQNQSVVELDAGYGEQDGVLIVHDPNDSEGSGVVTIGNNTTVQGSGDPDSFLMIVSRNDSASNGGGVTAITIGNGTATSMFFAPDGEISLSNNIDLVEVTGWRLHLQNSVTVEYDSGLANLNFSGGPSGGWVVRSWQEIE